MQGSYGYGIAHGHLAEVGCAPVRAVRGGNGRGREAVKVEIEGLAELVLVKMVQEFLGIVPVVGDREVPEHVVRRNLESFYDRDFPGSAMLPFVVDDMVVVTLPGGEIAVVGRDLVVEGVDETVFYDGGEGCGLEYGPGLSLPSYDHVESLVEGAVGAVPQEVHHCPDRSGGDIHHDYAASFYLVRFGNLLAQGFIGDVLDIDIEGGAYVLAVFRRDEGAVEVLYPFPVFRLAEVFDTFLSVKDVVEFSFEAYVVVAVGVVIVLHVSYRPPREGSVGILPCVLPFHDDAAGISSL